MLIDGMDFINDEIVIGKWVNIGWSKNINTFNVEGLNVSSNEFKDLYFLPNGEGYWIFEGWTKGYLLIHYGGNKPILIYAYETKKIDNNQYLFLRMEDKTEVFLKVSNQIFQKDTLGNHDNIDLPFIYDERIIGTWSSVGFVDKIEQFNPALLNDNLYLTAIEFKNDGTAIQKYMDEDWHDQWTKGALINLHRTTVAAYEIRPINGREYLFLEWKMGNYIYGGIAPSYYVFIKE